MAVSGDHYLEQELSPDYSDDEAEEEASTSEVDDADSVVSEDNNVDVKDKDALTSGSESGKDEEVEDSNERSVRISATEAESFYKSSLQMRKNDWGNLGEVNLYQLNDLKNKRFAGMAIKTRTTTKQKDIIKVTKVINDEVEDFVQGMQSWSITEDVATLVRDDLNIF